MKKSLIALAALSAFATAAQAQSSVSVYGVIDASYGDIETKTSNVGKAAAKNTASSYGGAGAEGTKGALSSSRLGFKGTEDLGGGMAANFNLEYQLYNGTGDTVTSNIRTSTVGLSSTKLGSINVGRQLTGIHGVLTATSPLAANNMAGDIIYSADASTATNFTQKVGLRMHSGAGGVDAVRNSNSVSYVTPAISGFTGRVDYANDKSNADSTVVNNDAKRESTGFSLTYNQGPVLVTAGTHTVKTKAAAVAAVSALYVNASGAITATSTPSTDLATYRAAVTKVDSTNDENKFQVDAIAGRYTMGALKLNVIYAQKKQSYESTSADSYKADATQFGVSYDIGNVTLAGQYGEGSTKFTNPGATSFGAKVDSKAFQLAAIYNLSKRTNVYAAYGEEDRKLKSTDAAKKSGTIGDKTDRTQLAVGLRHSF